MESNSETKQHLGIKIKGMKPMSVSPPPLVQHPLNPPALVPPPSFGNITSPTSRESNQLRQLQERIESLKQQIVHLRQENLQQARELEKRRRGPTNILETSQVINVDQQRQMDRSEIARLREENERLNNILMQTSDQKRQVEAAAQQSQLANRKTITDLQREVSKLNTKLQEASQLKQHVDQKQIGNNNDALLREKETTIMKLMGDIEELRGEHEKLKVESPKKEEHQPNKNPAELERVNAELKKKTESSAQQLNRMNIRLTDTLTDMAKLKAQLQQLKQDNKDLEVRLRIKQDAQRRLEARETELEALKAAQGNGMRPAPIIPNRIEIQQVDQRGKELEAKLASKDNEINTLRVAAQTQKEELITQLQLKIAQLRSKDEEVRALRVLPPPQPAHNPTIEQLEREFACYRSEFSLKMQSCRKEREELLVIISMLRSALPKDASDNSSTSSRSTR